LHLPTQTKVLRFWLTGKLVPKARPRFNGTQAFLPSGYRGWKTSAYLEIWHQLSQHPKMQPIRRASVEIQLVGKHRGDLDNAAGSVLDVLVEAGVLVDDRLSCVSRLVVEHLVSTKCGVWVEVLALD